jgi:serine/threonine protein kinase
LRTDQGFGGLSDYLIDNSVFEEGSVLNECDRISSDIYHRSEDNSLMIVKSKSVWESQARLKIEIENQLNLCHPCILTPIGFIFGSESSVSGELQIVRLYAEGGSLSEVISKNPSWWTATEKAKAVAGIVLSLRFAYSLGLIHGHLTSNNIVFDVDHRIQITDFCRTGESENEPAGFSGEKWSRNRDLRGFAAILFEIIVGQPGILSGVVESHEIVPRDIPLFVTELMGAGQSAEPQIPQSSNAIFGILKKNDFRIVSGVDSADVLAFVGWVESFE